MKNGYGLSQEELYEALVNRTIKSIDLPIVELPIDMIKEIFDVMLAIYPENYVHVINA